MIKRRKIQGRKPSRFTRRKSPKPRTPSPQGEGNREILDELMTDELQGMEISQGPGNGGGDSTPFLPPFPILVKRFDPEEFRRKLLRVYPRTKLGVAGISLVNDYVSVKAIQNALVQDMATRGSNRSNISLYLSTVSRLQALRKDIEAIAGSPSSGMTPQEFEPSEDESQKKINEFSKLLPSSAVSEINEVFGSALKERKLVSRDFKEYLEQKYGR